MGETVTLQQVRRVDFLRHIVNRTLAEPGAPRQLVDDIRRMIGKAEDKYKFNAFGGDVRKLADYLRSRDFDDLITLVRGDRSGQGIEILKRILNEARKAYSEIPEIVEVIDVRLKELETAEESKKEKKLNNAYALLKDLEKAKAKVELDKEENKIRVIALDGKFTAILRYDEDRKTYTLSYKAEGSLEFDNLSEAQEYLQRLISALHGKGDR